MRCAPSRLVLAAVVPLAAMTTLLPSVASPVAEATPADRGTPATRNAPAAPSVREVPVRGIGAGSRALPGRMPASTRALSRAVPTKGYVTVGAVWNGGAAASGRRLQLRTRTGDRWTAWEQLHVDADHRPDAGTAEARRARPGTDAYVVGAVDDVQLRLTASDAAARLRGLRLVVVEPAADETRTAARSRLGSPAYPATNPPRGVTPRPAIYSRAQWGADESLRSGFAGYGKISGSFVHHTVNANDYSAAQVPAILRAIYAYHVQGRGWSDVGYNFLVDRFGRIWEGRWGGIKKAVIGAHTLGYNEESFAVSAIGNFDVVRPSDDMIRAYGRVLAWKLSRNGVDADSTVRIDGDRFKAINGHRDAAATACPGRYLYDRLGAVRSAATARQRG